MDKAKLLEEFLKALIVFALGAGGLALFQFLRERRKMSADIRKTLEEADKIEAETQKILHDTDNQNFTIRSEQLQKWIDIAAAAQEKIGDLREELAKERIANIPLRKELHEVQEKLKLCEQSMQKIQDCGCSEK